MRRIRLPVRAAAALLGLVCASAPALAEAARPRSGPPSSGYVADFVSTAAFGVAMNAAGDVIGTSYTDTGCGPWCLPPLETVAWRGGQRIVLPTLPGFTGITVRGINAQGWITGFAGPYGFTTHAVVWKPSGNSYTVLDLGTLPGTTASSPVGIDDQGRVVGWSTTLSFPGSAAPFVWTEAGGMVDLGTLGFPADEPSGLSSGGTVATAFAWYRLDEPGVVHAMPQAPTGYLSGGGGVAINDAGDQARFLTSTSTENLLYLFRYHHEGTWQQVSTTGGGHLSRNALGSINAQGDITATVVSSAVVAYGPDGLAEPLAPYLSPAYAGSEIAEAGMMNSEGEILAQVMIGRSQRLMRLVPAEPCFASCLRVSPLQMGARFVEDPRNPGQCSPGGRAYNIAKIKVTVTNEAGDKQAGVVVSGRILDDYWTNAPVTGTTNGKGAVVFTYRGPCGVGALAFLVDDAVLGVSGFDRTVGTVAAWVIPSTGARSAEAAADGGLPQDDGDQAQALPGDDAAFGLSLASAIPARDAVTFAFALPTAGPATLRVFDASGAVVATLADGSLRAGPHRARWSLAAAARSGVPRGVYWARLEAGGATRTVRVAVIR